VTATSGELSLAQLLDPAVLADPYPLYRRLRTEHPVYWDPLLHAWVVTRYADVVDVLHRFSARRTPTRAQLENLGLGVLGPVADVMVRQMLFLDGRAHARVRGLAAKAFTPRRVAAMREHIQGIADRLADDLRASPEPDLIAGFAEPLPAIVTAEMLGVPVEDWPRLKAWSAAFAEMLGNFQHNRDRAAHVVGNLEEMAGYFTQAIETHRGSRGEGLVAAFLAAEADGDRFSDEEVVANCIITMVGGQETTTNLIGNGMLTLLRHPEALAALLDDAESLPAAVEELLRFESPSQHTARLAPDDTLLGGHCIRKRQAVIAVMAAANRDPARFADPDRLDLRRPDNRHLAFGWAAHFCFGAALARLEGQLAIGTLVRRLPALASRDGAEPAWRHNLGLRGLRALPVRFRA
jgi:cytochrome P450